jgi:hypothetical protein
LSWLGALFGAVGGAPIGAAEIRAEAWALGSRHRGEVLDGARQELEAAGITPRRASLLRAVIRSQPA